MRGEWHPVAAGMNADEAGHLLVSGFAVRGQPAFPFEAAFKPGLTRRSNACFESQYSWNRAILPLCVLKTGPHRNC